MRNFLNHTLESLSSHVPYCEALKSVLHCGTLERFPSANEKYSHLRRGPRQEAAAGRGGDKHNLVYFNRFNFGTIRKAASHLKLDKL